MGSKIGVNCILKLAFLLLFSCVIVPSFASEPTDLVRVGITDNKFQNVLRQDIKLYATSEAVICDKQTQCRIFQLL